MPPDRLEISGSSSPRKWGFDETTSLMTNRQIDYCVCLQTFLITLQQMNQQPRKQIGDRNVAGVQTNRLRIRWNSDGWTDKQTDNRSKNSFFQACCSFSSSSGGRSSPTLQQPRYVWLRMSAVGVGIAPATNVRGAPCVFVHIHLFLRNEQQKCWKKECFVFHRFNLDFFLALWGLKIRPLGQMQETASTWPPSFKSVFSGVRKRLAQFFLELEKDLHSQS